MYIINANPIKELNPEMAKLANRINLWASENLPPNAYFFAVHGANICESITMRLADPKHTWTNGIFHNATNYLIAYVFNVTKEGKTIQNGSTGYFSYDSTICSRTMKTRKRNNVTADEVYAHIVKELTKVKGNIVSTAQPA